MKIPVARRYGSVHVPVNTHEEIKEDYEICESKLYREHGTFYLNITVTKEVELETAYDGVLGIDLGLRHPVVSVALPSRETMFDGHHIRDTQSHYFWLRRQTKYGTNRRKWHRKEYNKVRDCIQKLTTKVVKYAKKHDLVIAVGNLEGIQEGNEGRTMIENCTGFPTIRFENRLHTRHGGREWYLLK